MAVCEDLSAQGENDDNTPQRGQGPQLRIADCGLKKRQRRRILEESGFIAWFVTY
jgi:hypothetical protein